VKIFNRWGNQVFDTKNYKNDWKGTWNGGALPNGVYFWVIDLGDGSKVRTGFVVIEP
jgi:large repetitive protein